MSGFNNNTRLQDHIMYSLDWAIFLRHNLNDQLMPFLFEWEDEILYKNMLQPGGDPEEFAYRIAEKSERNSDQFVVGYEGMLTDQEGKKSDAFIVKGYDRTQDKGVFIAQVFIPKEKGGQFKLIGKPMLISNPDLPFSINTDIDPSYQSEELYASGMVVNDNDPIAILSHFNPSVVASGIKNFMRGKLQGKDSSRWSGNLEISIAPQESFGDFFKYTVTRVIEEELNSQYVLDWKNQNNKQINLICKHGHDLIYKTSDDQSKIDNKPQAETPKSAGSKQRDLLLSKYREFSRLQMDNEYHRIISVPNAAGSFDCINQLSALKETYKTKGIPMPNANASQASKSKSGCMSLFFVLLISVAGLIVI